MNTIFLATANHTDDSQLDVTVAGVTKEAAEKALRDCIDEMAKDLAEDVEDEDERAGIIESSKEMYIMNPAYEVPLHK